MFASKFKFYFSRRKKSQEESKSSTDPNCLRFLDEDDEKRENLKAFQA